MESKKLFITLPVDPVVATDIMKKFTSLDLPWEKIKKIDPKQIHLTLKFLGDFNIEKIPDLLNSLNKINLKIEDIEIQIAQTQIFSPQRPKVLALSTVQNSELQELYDEIEQILFDDGLAHKEIRRFSTHLTLARIKQVVDFKELNEFNNWKIKKSFFVPYFEILESEMTKNGPEYISLQTFDL